MIKDLVEFKKYIAENKIFVFVSLIISILIYYLKMTTPIIGMDTNGFLFDQEGYNKHWLSIGRVGEVLIKKYIWRGNNNIFLWNTVSCLLFTFSVVFFSFMLSKIINDRKHLRLLLPCLILSSPLFVFQYYFVLQMFEFSLSLNLVLFSIYLIEFLSLNRILKSIIVIFLLGITFGVYNTFVFYYILIVSSIILFKITRAYRNDSFFDFKNMISEYICYGIYCILGVLFYIIVNFLVLRYCNITQVSHATNMIYWTSAPLSESLKKLFKTLMYLFFKPGIKSGFPFYNYLPLIMLLCMFLSLYKLFLKRKDLFLQAIFSSAVLCSSGLGIVLITAAADLPRTMVPQFPFMIAIGIYWSMMIFNNNKLHTTLLMLLCFFTCLQVRDSLNLVVSEKMTFEEDYVRMVEIDMAIKDLHLSDDYKKKVVLTGNIPSKNRFNIGYPNELVGVSMFNFAFSSDNQIHSYYVGDNILIIMDTFGMKYNKPTLNEYQDAIKRHPELLSDTSALRCFSDDKYIYVHVR